MRSGCLACRCPPVTARGGSANAKCDRYRSRFHWTEPPDAGYAVFFAGRAWGRRSDGRAAFPLLLWYNSFGTAACGRHRCSGVRRPCRQTSRCRKPVPTWVRVGHTSVARCTRNERTRWRSCTSPCRKGWHSAAGLRPWLQPSGSRPRATPNGGIGDQSSEERVSFALDRWTGPARRQGAKQ
jgi:hypothetical protein